MTGSPTRRYVLAGALSTLAASSAQAYSAPNLATLKPGTLRIGTYFVNPPFEYLSRGKRVGFEVTLMEQIAHRLGLRPVFIDTTWETILRQMQERRYDCIVGGITVTPSRRRRLAWSNPYMTTTLSLIVDSSRSPNIRSIADLAHAAVGVQAATTDADAADAMQRAGIIGSVKVYPFVQIADAISDLQAGHISAVMKVRPVADWFVRHTPELRILAQVPGDPQPLGIGFALGATELVAAVNKAISDMKNDGTYATLALNWHLSEP